MNREGREEPLPLAPASYRGPRVSPDGTRVAVDIFDLENTDVWISDLARGTLSRLTDTDGPDGVPMWTPDSESVVFASSRENTGVFSLFQRRADGTGPVEKILTGEEPGNLKPYGWSPDGMRMVFDYGQPPNLDIGVLTMDGEETWEPLLQSEANEAAPALSPNGEWIAYTSDQTGRSEIYVQRFPDLGDRQLVSSGGGTQPVWSPDGRELFYRDDQRLMSIGVGWDPVFTLDTPVVVFEGAYDPPSHFRRSYDLHPDGQQFLMVKPGGLTDSDTEEAIAELVLVQNWFEELTRLVPTDP